MTSSASFFPTPALDHAFAGIGAGTVAVLCMQPLDMLKVKYQVETSAPPASRFGKGTLYNNPLVRIWESLREIKVQQGWRGLYRGVGANVAGNASSWGLYFWFYTMIKTNMVENPSGTLTSAQYLTASAEASAITALMTNPIWVVKVRMFTSRSSDPNSYRGLIHGLREISKTEGIRGMYRGTWMALFGVSSGAVQFMAYEQMKNFAFARKKRKVLAEGGTWKDGEEKLSNTTYTLVSATAKVFALVSTYPYQVIRSRIQKSTASATPALSPSSSAPPSEALSSTTSPSTSSSSSSSHPLSPKPPLSTSSSLPPKPSSSSLSQPQSQTPSTFRAIVRQTWAHEGYAGFYRGMATNLVRVLPGTCITFVVYENLAWFLRTTAMRREEEGKVSG